MFYELFMIMLVLLSILFLFYTAINILQCAPKLGYISFDPLSHEAKLTRRSKDLNKDKVDLLKEHLRMPLKREEIPKEHCSGYDYNETLCKTVDDRVICGYDKNIGNISDKIVNLGNGCKIRGDRLECGYFEGPFNASRRPPANDEGTDRHINILNLRYGPTRTSNVLAQFKVTLKPKNYNLNFTTLKQELNLASQITTKTTKVKTPPVSSISTTIMNNSTLTASYENVTSISRRSNVTRSKRYCVDKSDRIFCYSIKQ